MTLMVSRWDSLDGYAVAHNMPDLRTIDLGRLSNFIYWRTIEGADAEEVDKFRARLWQPPRGVLPDKRSPWAAEAETSAFSQARAALGLPPSPTQAPQTRSASS